MLSKSMLKPMLRATQKLGQIHNSVQPKINQSLFSRPISSRVQKFLDEQMPTHFKSSILAANPKVAREFVLAGYKKADVESMTDAHILFYLESRITDKEFENIQKVYDMEAVRQQISKDKDTDLEDVRMAMNGEVFRFAMKCESEKLHFMTLETNGVKNEKPTLMPLTRPMKIAFALINCPKK